MSSSKTIAKNTMFLYFRMILVMGVSLFTSRIVLRELGVSDYGIYSLVGGVVAMFGFFNAAMSSATQRYLAFDIGRGDYKRLQKTFSATLTIHFGIALLVFILAETIGLWYVSYKMVFQPERAFAVNVVYQFSIAVSIIGVIQVPYNALIVARERMNIFAYVSILDVILKLIIVFLLVFFGSDKLIAYSILIFAVSFIITIVYQIYCRRNFKESKYKLKYEKEVFQGLISYSGWSLFGNLAVVGKWQGTNILLNLFFGTLINSAYGIALQVNGAISSFITNFQTAVKPQIIQTYAQNNLKRTYQLITQSSRLSFLMIFLLSMPIIFNIEFILSLWLVEVPTHTSNFVVLILIAAMVDSLAEPLITGIHASGNIRTYQILLSFIILMGLSATYIFLKAGYSPEVVLSIMIAINIFAFVYRLFSCSKLTGLGKIFYLQNTLLRSIIVVVLSIGITLCIESMLVDMKSLMKFFISVTYILILNVALIILIGAKTSERNLIFDFIKSKIKK